MSIKSIIHYTIECDTCHLVVEDSAPASDAGVDFRKYGFTAGLIGGKPSHECQFCTKQREEEAYIRWHREAGTAPF